MNLPAIPLLGLLRERMSWLNARQNVLSENIANADTPGYTARDMKPLDFGAVLKRITASTEPGGGLAVTNPGHIAAPPDASDDSDMASADSDSNPTGNTVSLEQEMIKVADTQTQYQAAANIYSKAVDMMRTAIGNPNG
jgi:flagellar basal-body rod protein FlgB